MNRSSVPDFGRHEFLAGAERSAVVSGSRVAVLEVVSGSRVAVLEVVSGSRVAVLEVVSGSR